MLNWTQRRVLGEQSPSEHNRLQVRLVPYTPPRLSSASAGTCARCQCHQGGLDDHGSDHSDPGDDDPIQSGSPNIAVHASSLSWSTRAWSRSRQPPSSPCSSASSQRIRQPLRRRRARLITIRASGRNLSPLATSWQAPSEAACQRHRFSTTPQTHDRPVSPLTPLPELPSSRRPRSRDSHPETTVANASHHPRNVGFIRSLRRVRDARRYTTTSATFASPVLSTSTLSRCNYTTHVHRDVSPLSSPNLTPSSSNVRVLAESTPDGHHGDATRVCVHGQPPLPRLRPEFSRESMVVSPLRYKSTSPPDNHTSWRSRSGSLASASSVMVDEVARSLFAAVGAPRRSRQRLHHASDSTASCLCQRCGLTPGLDSPPALLSRHATRQQSRGTIRAIRDHDEHGDGLADLDHIPSRPRLHSFRSSFSSERPLPSSSGSRRSSLSRSSIPAWARLYYGSGERRFLAPKSSLDSLSSSCDRPRTATVEDRRARAGTIDGRLAERRCIVGSRRGPSSPPNRLHGLDASCEADYIASTPHPPTPTHNIILRHQTSSIWSPHLGPDRRPIAYSIWDPPSSLWSRSWLGSCRDFQPLLFVAGFLCPLAWMAASFLSLPPRPSHHDLMQVRCDTSHLNSQIEANHLTSDDLLIARRYSRARWWRSLNRAMSVLGVFVIGAAVALVVTGVKQKRL